MASEAERASRPNSLLLETPPPEREPLRFDVQLVGAPPEVEQLVNNIKQVAEDFLYHWKTFPIVLPSSRFTGPGNRPSDIIIAPPCDELDAAALDAGVEPHPLSPKQLHAIREKGEFEVPSRHFPGQTHVWRVAGWLQRGHARAREELYGHVARACCLIVLVARDRLLRDEPLSLRRGGDAALKGLRRLMDLIFGMPSLEAKDLEKKIREERSRYLVAELICMPEHQEDIAALAAWVTRAMRRAASEKTDVREPPRVAPRVPCIYTTPQRTQVDLRLYRRELVRRAAGPLQALLEREARGWFLHFRERRAASLASQKVPPRDIEQEVRAAAMREYVSRVCAAVAASEQLRALGPGVPELLADQLRAHAIISRAEEGVRNKIEAGLATASARLVAAHPLLAAAGAWRRERLAAAAARLEAGLRWAALEAAAQDMLQHKLPQHRYFLLRDLAFLRDREPLLMKELRAAKTPTREFSWETRIWRPHNWVIVRHFRGRSERIPTVLSTRATSIVTPRSDPSQPVFLVDKEIVRRTSTRWPGWRLVNLAHRCWSWSWNMMFLLGVVVVWCSPLSLRTLLRVRALVPELELSQVNGTLFPKRSSETQTMWSRLLKLWRHVSKERTRFETEPDTGLLGKGLSRQANRIWNYGVVGGLGSLCLLLLFPIVALVTCALSLAAAAAVPLWMPALTLAVYAGNALVYDLDCPDPPRLNRWFVLFEVLVWQIAVLGILQPIAALFVAIVVCPVCALLLLVGGVSWWGLRALWEALAWRALIRRMARVPAHDSAFCRRVDGPGLRSRTHYQLTCAQAVAAVAARGEAQALAEWAAARERAVARPLHDYQHFVQACFGPFSVQIAQNAGGVYAQLEKECNELTASLREKVEARRQELALGLSDAARARVRMSAHDLRRAVQAAALELARLWGSEARGDDWWSTRGLEPGDWHALAANTLGEVFDPEILVALGDNEARLPLESGEGARAWAARCGRDEAPPDVLAERDDWRRAHGIWGEWGGAPPLRVPPPQLELGAFSPRPPPHPPLPAPPTVALVLHNRYTRGQWGGAPPLRVPPPQLELGAFSPRPPPHPPLPAPPTVALVLHNRYTRGQWGGAPPLRVPPPQLELGAFSPRPPPHPPLPAPPTVALVLHNRYTRGQWGGAPPLRVPPPQLELGAFSPRPPPHPPLPAPPTVALVLHNRESDNPVPLDSELCAEILRSLEDAPDCDDRRDGVERYRGGGSEEGTSDGNSEGTLDDDASSQHTREAEGALCRVMPSTERAACRWTLTGRGVRLRADLASPEDVTLDTDRSHGTSV